MIITQPGQAKVKGRRDLLRQITWQLWELNWIEPPVYMAYGRHVHIGEGFYANFNLVHVDDGDIYIGDNVIIGPNVTISPTGHPVHPELHRGGTQFSFPIKIGDDVWIGSMLLSYLELVLERTSVIGAGSVVTRDIPENVVAAGNPCRVLREINDRDRSTTTRTEGLSLLEAIREQLFPPA